jgi:hypothetical protein
MIFMVMIVLLFYHVLPTWIKKGPAKPPSPRGCGMAYMHLDDHLYKNRNQPYKVVPQFVS